MARPLATLGTDVREEFRAASLGDERLNRRLARVIDHVATAPEMSFPKAMRTEAEREAAYRFLRNDRVSWTDIVEPHIEATIGRCGQYGLVRIVHDTTDFVFSGRREGLGRVMSETTGFFLHLALAVGEGEGRPVLGTVGMLPYVRGPKGTFANLNEQKREVRKMARTEKESARWEMLALETSSRLPTREVIHVMDREANDYAVMAALRTANLRFVIRGTKTRVLAGRVGNHVGDVLESAPSVVFRKVQLSRRPDKGSKTRKTHPPRREREAELELRWSTVRLERPQHAQAEAPFIELTVVQVFEPAPPEGETPIEWTLFTTERVDSAEEAALVVDHYRARWVIEEYFKALKTGCAYQERQLESLDTLLVALALFVPIAWHLLLLRTLAREDAPVPASAVFVDEELLVLRELARSECRHEMPLEPTVRDALRAVAALGGHIRNNGEPGWIVLGRGYDDLCKAVAGWRLHALLRKASGEM